MSRAKHEEGVDKLVLKQKMAIISHFCIILRN